MKKKYKKNFVWKYCKIGAHKWVFNMHNNVYRDVYIHTYTCMYIMKIQMKWEYFTPEYTHTYDIVMRVCFLYSSLLSCVSFFLLLRLCKTLFLHSFTSCVYVHCVYWSDLYAYDARLYIFSIIVVYKSARASRVHDTRFLTREWMIKRKIFVYVCVCV